MARESAPPAQFPWASVGELAVALGVHRNTVANWARDGAPPGPPYCELQWRIWAAAKGRQCERDPEPRLLEMLVKAGIPEYRRRVEPAAPAAAAEAGTKAPTLDAKEAKAAADARRAQVEAEEAERRLDESKGRLVPIDQVEQLVMSAMRVAVSALDVLPGLAASMPCSPATQEALRVAIEDRLRAERERLADQATAELQRWIDAWGKRHV